MLLREELVGTIKELHTSGDPSLEQSVMELVTQLEQMQSTPGEPLQLEWERAGFNATQKKKICFVVSSFEGLYINSGIGTAYYALAELLARGGNSVTVLYTRDQPPTVGSFNDWVQHYQQQGIQLRSLPPPEKRVTNPKLQVVSAQVYQYLKNNHYDVVHFHDFEGLGFYSSLAKRVGLGFENTVFVAGLHGPTRWVLDANERRGPTHESELEVDFMERMSVENADVVWTPSNVLASWLSQQGWNFTRGVHLLPLPPGPEVQGVKESVHVKAKELVFFGRLEKRKGLMLFCDAVDLLANLDSSATKHISITFLGSSSYVDGNSSLEYINGRSSSWSFPVKVISNYSRKAALNYLMQHKAGRIPVIPSIIDNAPYTAYECLYAGIPFLASATPSITPLLAKHGHHLFELKPHSLAAKMIYAAKNGLASAKATFTSRQSEDTWFSFYSQLRVSQAAASHSNELPVVSVCIVHFNRPQLVEQAINSIIAQDYKKIEVILVDDGSNQTDAIEYLDTAQKLFDAQGWKIIRTENRYLGAARNTAAKQAKGKYLLFLDDDNVAFPNQVSTYVNAAEKTKANIVTAAHAVFKGTSKPSYANVERMWYPLGASLPVGLFKNCFGDANFFVERETFMAIGGFTEEYGVGLEEHEFFAKAVFGGYSLEVIPEPLLYYRMHDENNQMLFSQDVRMGEARRMRPYIAAMTATAQNNEPSDASVKTRRSLVQLVARNAMESYQDCNQTLSTVSPSSGPVSGGTTISLKGVGFTCGVQAVRIDGQECTGISVVSNYEITCQTPVGSRTYVPVDITAEVGGQTISLYSAWTYTSLAAPAMNSCRLADDGNSISCAFSSLTDQSSGSCSKFFSTTTVASFGSGPNCFWTSTSNLEIDLGSGATIKIGDTISILAGSVKSQGDVTVTNEASSTPLLAPLHAAAPIASISTPSSVGSCEGITLDASSSTGGLGRALNFTWSLVSIEPSNDNSRDAINQVIAQANAQGSSKIIISANDAAVATYTFSLTITTWIGTIATTTSAVSKSSDSVQSVSISGPSVVSIFKNAALNLVGQVSASCNATLGSTTYSWKIDPSVNLDASALTSASLSVPENTFTAGKSYTATFTATDNGLSNSATVTITVGARALVASIAGGNKQYETSDTVSLDGSASNDPEGLDNFAFAWSCTDFYDSSKSCNINTPTTAIFSFSGSSLGTGKYTFTLTVSGALSRTVSTSVWIEIADVSVLSISIQALAKEPVDPTASLSLVGVLNQAGVSEAEVTWSWSLISGSLSNPSTAYASGLDAETLVIAADALTPGAQYTYKLSATQASTGVSGTATITFSVDKAPTTGEFGCAVTTGNAESTDFNYDFGQMWGSTSGISSYEIRFVPDNSLLEIPLAEPSIATTFTTKLPKGNYPIIGIATSTNGVSARKECAADVTYSDNSAGLSSIATAAEASGLSAFQIARYAFGAKSTYKATSSGSSSTLASIRSSLRSATSSAMSGLTSSSVTALTGAFVVLSETDIGILTESELVSTISAFGNLLDAQASISKNNSVLAADVQILSNLIDQLSNQDLDVRVLVKRDTTANQDMWSAFQNLITIADKVAAQYLSGVASGQSQITLSQALLTLSLYAGSTSQMTSQGVTIGSTSTIKLLSGFVPAGVSADTVSLTLASWGVSPYPASSSIVSPVLILTATAGGSKLDLSNLPSPASVFVPKSELLDSTNLACVTWSSSSSNWTTDSCTTTASNSGVTCLCDNLGQPIAVTRSASSKASTANKGSSGGLQGKWIGVIAGVGGVALIAVIVGSVFAVKRRRASQGGVASTSAPSSFETPVAAAATAPVPLAGVAVARTEPNTPVVGSSYSSASSRSIVSSSSSEEEVMEQQIKDIVGELSTALPRDPRALEVLGDRLDLE